ncbi:MAG: insulinase family protein [Nitrospirae bacterium]|nr:insulinase family protein [Nitrospirota bacterium]
MSRLIAIALAVLYLFTGSAFGSEIREHFLPNGLKIVTVENHKSPVVTFQVWYKVGSRNEITGRTGISHLLEHMMFKGTPKYGKGEYSGIVARNGGNENAFTSQDYTAYFQNISSDRLEISFDLESDRMVNLLLDPNEFMLERDVVKEERRLRTEDDPVSSLIEELYAAAFKIHPYHSPIIGWMTDLDNLSREDTYNYYKTYYRPDNATIVVVGDFNTEDLINKIGHYFGGIPKGEPMRDVKISEDDQKGERRFLYKREAQLPYVIYGYHAPNYKDRDHYALELLNNILSGGKSSRLYQNIVYSKQIALTAGGGFTPVQTDPELFYFYAQLKPDRTTEEAEAALKEEIERIKREPVSTRELQKARNQIEASFIMGQDSVFYQAMLIGQLETTGAGAKYLESYIDEIRQVTPEDIMRVANKYFMDDNRTVGVLVPLPQKQ